MTAAELLGMAQAEGVALALAGDRLTWSAARPPPPELLAGISSHRLEIIAALSAANDTQTASELSRATKAPAPLQAPAPVAERAAEAASEPRRNAWQVARSGNPICHMVMAAPATHAEALAEARWRWPDADILEN